MDEQVAKRVGKLDELRSRGVLSDDEFQRAKQHLLATGAAPSGGAAGVAPAVTAVNSFRRSLGDKWLGGVCGGLAAATGVESWVWRLIVTLLALLGGTGVLLYLLLWIFVPTE